MILKNFVSSVLHFHLAVERLTVLSLPLSLTPYPSVANIHSATFKSHAHHSLHSAHVDYWKSKFARAIN